MDRVRGGGVWKLRGGEGKGRKGGRETEENFACAKRALLKEGSRETRGFWGVKA